MFKNYFQIFRFITTCLVIGVIYLIIFYCLFTGNDFELVFGNWEMWALWLISDLWISEKMSAFFDEQTKNLRK